MPTSRHTATYDDLGQAIARNAGTPPAARHHPARPATPTPTREPSPACTACTDPIPFAIATITSLTSVAAGQPLCSPCLDWRLSQPLTVAATGNWPPRPRRSRTGQRRNGTVTRRQLRPDQLPPVRPLPVMLPAYPLPAAAAPFQGEPATYHAAAAELDADTRLERISARRLRYT